MKSRGFRPILNRVFSRTLGKYVRGLADIRDRFSRDSHLNRKARSKASRLQLPATIQAETLTSVSDYLEYRQIVEAATLDELVFNSFRSHKQYSPILEHVSKKQGEKYLEVIRRRSNLPKNWVRKLDPLNDIGSPQKHTYPEIGRFSPTILRYVKVFSDLELLFGPLRGLRCAEIGIGFGGQAAILRILGEVGELELFDLPPVLKLAERFLQSCGVSSSIGLRDGTAVSPVQGVDLIISNYAFSELTRELQVSYLDNVIGKASMGYITWNSLSPDGLSPGELLSLIPGSRLLEEEPKTHADNLILTWGSDRVL